MTDTVQSGVAIDVETFSWSHGALELAGRWSGVRGKRFVRPTLTGADPHGTTLRLLASLDDKPWAAEDDEQWHASFPCPAPPAPGTEFELEVGGGIVCGLRLPGGEQVAPPPPEDPRAELTELRTRYEQARSESRSTQARLDTARAERQELAMARERAEADLRRVTRERDSALEELDAAAAERAELKRDRDKARKAERSAAKKRDSASQQGEVLRAENQRLSIELQHNRRRASEQDAELLALHDQLTALRSELEAERARPPAPAEPPPQPLSRLNATWRREPPSDEPSKHARAVAAAALLLVLALLVALL